MTTEKQRYTSAFVIKNYYILYLGSLLGKDHWHLERISLKS